MSDEGSTGVGGSFDSTRVQVCTDSAIAQVRHRIGQMSNCITGQIVLKK